VKNEQNLFKPPLAPLLMNEGKSSEIPNVSKETFKLMLIGNRPGFTTSIRQIPEPKHVINAPYIIEGW